MVRFIHVLKYQFKIANLVGGIKGTIVLLTLTWIGGWYLEDFLVILCILKKWFLSPLISFMVREKLTILVKFLVE